MVRVRPYFIVFDIRDVVIGTITFLYHPHMVRYIIHNFVLLLERNLSEPSQSVLSRRRPGLPFPKPNRPSVRISKARGPQLCCTPYWPITSPL